MKRSGYPPDELAQARRLRERRARLVIDPIERDEITCAELEVRIKLCWGAYDAQFPPDVPLPPRDGSDAHRRETRASVPCRIRVMALRETCELTMPRRPGRPRRRR